MRRDSCATAAGMTPFSGTDLGRVHLQAGHTADDQAPQAAQRRWPHLSSMPRNPPNDPVVPSDPAAEPPQTPRAAPGSDAPMEPDLSADGGGQRTEVGRPYDGEGNERGIPPGERR